MPVPSTPQHETHAGPRWFATTHWSVVLAAGSSEPQKSADALEHLCRTYWYPLYAFIRRRGYSESDAQDLTQAFFSHLLEQRAFVGLRPDTRCKFRSFLLTALKNYLAKEWDRARALKRGGGLIICSLDTLEPEARYALEPADLVTPDLVFEQRWADTVLDRSLRRLRAEHAGPKAALFEALLPCLTGADCGQPYGEIGGRFGLTEAAVKMAVYRLRRHYGELLREEVAHTVADPAEVEEELRSLLRAAAGCC